MKDFKELKIWMKAHKMTMNVYEETRCFPKEELYGLTSQLRRAAASTGANAEGCGRRSDGEMARFVHIAMGSGAELSYHLLLAKDLELLSETSFAHLRSDLSEVMRMLSSLSERLKPRVEVVQLRAKS